MQLDAREQLRLEQIDKCLPDLFDCKTLLYIGAYEKRFHFSSRLKEKGIKVDVLEADPINCEWLRTQEWLNQVIEGDVRDILTFALPLPYDVLLWSHGPNMIYNDDLQKLLPKLDQVANTIVLLTNWGREYQYRGNTPDLSEFMTTKEANEIGDFPGYFVDTIGRRNYLGNNLLAWRNNG